MVIRGNINPEKPALWAADTCLAHCLIFHLLFSAPQFSPPICIPPLSEITIISVKSLLFLNKLSGMEVSRSLIRLRSLSFKARGIYTSSLLRRKHLINNCWVGEFMAGTVS